MLIWIEWNDSWIQRCGELFQEGLKLQLIFMKGLWDKGDSNSPDSVGKQILGLGLAQKVKGREGESGEQ